MTAGRPREFDYDKALEKAMRAFWSKGFEGTSIPDLAKAMGMNPPSIYATFGNKEELFRKTLDLYSRNSQAALRELLDAPTLRESMERFLRGTADKFACKETPKGCFSVQGALVGSDDAKSACKETTSRREMMVSALDERFKRAITDGEIPTDTDTKSVARFYTTVVQGMSIQSVGGASCSEMKNIAEQALKSLPG